MKNKNVAMGGLLLVVLTIFSSNSAIGQTAPATCAASGNFCVISDAMYLVQTGPNIGKTFNDGDSACASAAGNAYGTIYRNAQFVAADLNWGMGCYFDLYDVFTGTQYQGRYIYQNWVLTNQPCPVTEGQYWGYWDTTDVSVSPYGRLWCGYKPFFLIATLLPQAQCDSCYANSIHDPVNPASGAMFDTMTDAGSTANALFFKRFYNSSDTGVADVSSGWRHRYARSVSPKYNAMAVRAYLSSNQSSAQYANPATACTSGFAEIQAQVPAWNGAVAVYSGGNCQLSKSGVFIGSVPVYSISNKLLPTPSSVPIAYDVNRDDGQLIRFTVVNSIITAPPGISVRLVQTNNGFGITDASNNVEQYDANGRLMTITSRAGVVQIMSYDSKGRLNTVTDSFGHQLNFAYDDQYHLTSVSLR